MLCWREHHIVNQPLVLCIAAWFGKLMMVVVKHTFVNVHATSKFVTISSGIARAFCVPLEQ